MTFREVFDSAPFILTEGAVIERLRRDPSVSLDPGVLDTALLYQAEGPNTLRRLYREYLHIGYHHDLPILVLTPTWRANPERLAAARLPGVDEVCDEAFRLLDQVRDGYGEYASKIYIGGLMACRGDAYDPAESLSEPDAFAFHRAQASALAASGVDLLVASTLPASAEAVGIARAMAETGRAYILSFIVRPTGHLLDGTPLETAIQRIDREVHPEPLCYLLNCIHPSVFEDALNAAAERDPMATGRVSGLQANTSSRSPEELNGLSRVETEDPELFSARLVHLRLEFGIKVMGGCCGTDARHIFSLARRMRDLLPRSG